MIDTTELRSKLDESRALALLQRAIGVESITGNEAAFAMMLRETLASMGATNVGYRDFLPGRPNVWGVRRGGGGGRTLMLLGHTDTVHVDGWRERWAGTEREDPFCGAVVDGAIWGRGSGDLKAGICASLQAAALLDAANIHLRGDLVFAFIGDEESGQPDTGVSAGIKAFVPIVAEGLVPRADFAIYLEPTQLAVYSAQMGFFIADITITGRSAYFGVPELGRDALKAGHTVLQRLWDHSEDLGTRGEHPLIGRSFLLVTEVRSGGYIAVPGACKISLIRKLRPGEAIDSAVAELESEVREAVSNKADISVDIAYPAGRDHSHGGTPAEIDANASAVQALKRAVGQAYPGRGGIEGAPYWSEVPFLVKELDIPAVYCAPGDIRNCHTTDEHVELEEYYAGIVGLAAFMADFCGVANETE